MECERCGFELPEGKYEVCPECNYLFLEDDGEARATTPSSPNPLEADDPDLPPVRRMSKEKRLFIVLACAIFGILLLSYWYIEKQEQMPMPMQGIEMNVCDEAVKEYENAKKTGDKVDIAMQASIVCEAYLQANDQVNFQKWKAIEAQANKEAGITDGE